MSKISLHLQNPSGIGNQIISQITTPTQIVNQNKKAKNFTNALGQTKLLPHRSSLKGL